MRIRDFPPETASHECRGVSDNPRDTYAIDFIRFSALIPDLLELIPTCPQFLHRRSQSHSWFIQPSVFLAFLVSFNMNSLFCAKGIVYHGDIKPTDTTALSISFGSQGQKLPLVSGHSYPLLCFLRQLVVLSVIDMPNLANADVAEILKAAMTRKTEMRHRILANYQILNRCHLNCIM